MRLLFLFGFGYSFKNKRFMCQNAKENYSVSTKLNSLYLVLYVKIIHLLTVSKEISAFFFRKTATFLSMKLALESKC